MKSGHPVVSKLLLFAVTLLVFSNIIASAISSGRYKIFLGSENQKSEYSGYGRVAQYYEGGIVAVPNEYGVYTFDTVDKRDDYIRNGYSVFAVSPQNNIQYIVARVLGWRSISNSQDKYLIVYEPDIGIQQYRVAFESSDLFDRSETALAVEDVNGDSISLVGKPSQASFRELGFGVVRKVIKTGDIVVLKTVWDFPSLAKVDDRNQMLVSWVIVRRVGGVVALEREIARYGK